MENPDLLSAVPMRMRPPLIRRPQDNAYRPGVHGKVAVSGGNGAEASTWLAWNFSKKCCSTGNAAAERHRSAIAPLQDVLQPVQLSVYHHQAAVHRLGAKFCRRNHGDGKLAAVLAIRQDASWNCPRPALRLDEMEIDHPEHRVGLHAHQSRHRGHGDLPPVSLTCGYVHGTRDRPLHQTLRVSQEVEHFPGRGINRDRARQRLH